MRSEGSDVPVIKRQHHILVISRTHHVVDTGTNGSGVEVFAVDSVGTQFMHILLLFHRQGQIKTQQRCLGQCTHRGRCAQMGCFEKKRTNGD